MHAPAMISSSKSSVSAPSSPTSSSSSAEHVAREQLRGVLGHARRQVQRRDDLHVVLDHRLARLGQLAVAARLARHVDDHRARLHPFDGLRRDQFRRRATRHERRRDDDVEALDRVRQRLLLAARAPRRSARARSRPRRWPRGRGRATSRRATAPARRPPGARRSRSCARPGAWPWRAPAARRRRRRARAPSPAGSCPRRSSASGRSGPSPRRRAAPPCSRRRSPARTARPSTARARSAGSPPSRTPSRPRPPAPSSSAGSTAARGSRSGSSPARARGSAPGPAARSSATTSERHTSPASCVSSAPGLREGRVGHERVVPAPLCTSDVEALGLELADDLGHERHPVLARSRLLRNANPHEGRERIRS